MRIQAYSNSQYRKNNVQSFGAAPNAKTAITTFDKIGNFFNIEPNGSLTRPMFFIVATLFMLGGRFFESRSNDEKREVVTRDVPAVALSVAGAPLINQAVAYAVTKASGVPIVTNGKKFSFKNLGFTTQKQVKDWYSELSKADNPLVNLSEMIEENGGNIRKVMKKFGFTKQLDAISKSEKNAEILTALKDAQKNGTEAFKTLENLVRTVAKDNKVLKFAKNAQATVKLGSIGFMAALLGYFLPHLNIITTRKKYQKKLDEGKITQEDYEKRMMRTSPVFRVSSGVLSFHKTSAIKTFKNLLSMAEPSSHFE